jgi:DNA-binding LacI/PurR family transcriptional regulator
VADLAGSLELRKRGKRLVDDLAGTDEFEIGKWLKVNGEAKYTIPPLTTVKQPHSDLGRAAVNLIVEISRGELKTRQMRRYCHHPRRLSQSG